MNNLLELAELVNDEFICQANRECWGEAWGVDKEENGYSVSAFYAQSVDPSYLITRSQRDYCDKQQRQAYEDFCTDYGLEEGAGIPEGLEDRFYDYECKRFKPALLLFEIRQDEHGGAVHLELSINYKDTEYYRAMYADTLLSVNVSAEEFNAKPVAYWLEIIKQQFSKAIEE